MNANLILLALIYGFMWGFMWGCIAYGMAVIVWG